MPNTMGRPGATPDHDDGMIASIRLLVTDRPAGPAPQPDAAAPAAHSRQPRDPAPAPLLLAPEQRVAAAPEADMDTLRALVAEAVRAELQGETGTRATRRLRRLIQAEIAAALEGHLLRR